MLRFNAHRLSSTAMPVLRRLDPERAHLIALRMLQAGFAGHDTSPVDPSLQVTAFGLVFRNPIGLAAGFDKNAAAIPALMRVGFGFVEAGTVTPRPQAGNPRPRLFRLPEDRAVINRFGFNSEGIAAFVARIRAISNRAVPLGANVGINRGSTTPERDYAALVSAVAGYADYVTINVSSPNTPGLVGLQAKERLTTILDAIRQAVPEAPPLLVKLSPDLTDNELHAVVETAITHKVAGLIVCNTTTVRPPSLRSHHAGQTGGLSGRPLFGASTAMLRRTAELARGRLVLIGSGGIATGADILTKLRAGATLVQLYTELAYSGLALIPRLRQELREALTQQGFASVTDAIGADLR
jgi:dihydroorotate dehydrogenase